MNHPTQRSPGRSWKVWSTYFDLTLIPFVNAETVDKNRRDKASEVEVKGNIRCELLKPDNVLFNTCEDVWEVADKYEVFWNRLNPGDIDRPFSTHDAEGKVKVLLVEEVK